MAERTLERRPPLTADAPAPLTPRARQPPPFPDGAARHWIISSIVWLTVVDLFGLVLATEFVTPEAFGGISFLSFSRIRPSHVNGVILAWLTMMYFGALFYMLPRLSETGGVWAGGRGATSAWPWNMRSRPGTMGYVPGPTQAACPPD